MKAELEMNLDQGDFASLLEAQNEYFRSGEQRSHESRRRSLLTLSAALDRYEDALMEAVGADLRKSPFEAYTNEIAVLNLELSYTLAHFKSWMKPRKVRLEIPFLPSRGEIHAQALGSSLIIAPWNYPIQLILGPLIAALAAGNTAVLKPSEISTQVEKVIAEMIGEFFHPRQVAVVTGGPAITTELLRLPFNKIFFTGSPAVGKIVMRAAAEQLASVTLELGGKSPALVDETVDLEAAARMIAWGKFNNAGQTCIAPDYVLVQQSVKSGFLDALRKVLVEFYGQDPKSSPHFGRIINRRHFDRLTGYLTQGRLVVGASSDASELYIAPTILDCDDWEAPIMTEEIFGPILPVLGFRDKEEAIELVSHRPRPLALYIFSNDSDTKTLWRDSLSFGGGGIHSTLLQGGSSRLPFGGVGPSGLGSYHGKAGFDAFTHYKSLLIRNPRFEPGLFFPPRILPLALVKLITGRKGR